MITEKSRNSARLVDPAKRKLKAATPSVRVDFIRVNKAALTVLPSLLCQLLPGGRLVGREYVVRNPRRADKRAGSFKINARSGKWADFATGDRGGDAVSLIAYLTGSSQPEAARRLAAMIGVSADIRADG